jgi:hypothetical protein
MLNERRSIIPDDDGCDLKDLLSHDSGLAGREWLILDKLKQPTSKDSEE